jgi:hypothetical protein
VILAPKETPVHKVRKAILVLEVLRDLRAILAKRVLKVMSENRVPKAIPELRVLEVRRVFQALLLKLGLIPIL